MENIPPPIPGVQAVRDDWIAESPEVNLRIDPDRASLAGVTDRHVAASATAVMRGTRRGQNIRPTA